MAKPLIPELNKAKCVPIAMTPPGPLVYNAVMRIEKQKTAENPPAVGSHRLSSLVAIGGRALASADFLEIASEVVKLVVAELEVEYCDVFELKYDGTIQLCATSDGILETEQPLFLLKEGTVAAHVMRSLTPLAIDDASVETRFVASPWQRERGIVSSLIVPLCGPLRPLGLLEAHSARCRSFSADDVSFLQLLAHLLSGAMQRISPTRQKQDQKMRRAEQMMAIGQVAAGVAHELRNPLTSIKGLVQVNLREARRQRMPAEDLAVIEHEVRRMERTLHTFLDFARPPQPDRKPLLLNEIVHRVFALVAGRARKQSVALKQELQPDVMVNADRDQIQQLLLNLVLNALDAMPDGGTVKVTISKNRDGHVELSVCDTGPGIAPHILPKVFESFVSSKETGVGLGLPVSQRIAEDHEGTLSAYNRPGDGACFVLRLPAGI